MSTPRASIIISTWNGRHLLETCLPRVLRAVAEAGGDHEVIVVDDASRDDTVAYVRGEFPQVRLLALRRNLRFAGANNAAAQIARGEFLVFLNNDMLVEPDFLEPLLRPFRDPAVFAVTARIDMPPKYVGGREIRETGLVRARFEDGLFVLSHEDLPAADGETDLEPLPVLYAGGGSSAWRRDRFFELGGFDRLFRPFYFEDLDLSYRAQKAGWKVLFAPASRVVHQHRQTNNPRNFGPGYVEGMFGKNSLLFTWKTLTDQPLANAHFRRLWRLLMRPRLHPQLAGWFLRAAAQLPELLVKRHRARRRYVLSDAEVLRPGHKVGDEREGNKTAAPAPGSGRGEGRRVLVLGSAPLPFAGERAVDSRGWRTWQVAQALAADGHEVTVVGCRCGGALDAEAGAPVVTRHDTQGIVCYVTGREAFEEGALLRRLCEQRQPEAIVAIHAYCAWAASRLPTGAPLWADLGVLGSAGETAEESDLAWQWERAALTRADAFSAISEGHRHALMGELAAIGRLGAGDVGEPEIHCLPSAIENAPYHHTRSVLRGKLVADDDFVILWCGGLDKGTDVDTLFLGVSSAMREEARLRFVCLGEERAALHDLRRKAEACDLADRFVFLAWPGDEAPNYYFESDVGISIERSTYQTQLGEHYRLVDMMRAGLPVITTLSSEISRAVQEERLGLTCAPGDAEGVKQAILVLARDESLRRRCGERARQWVCRRRALQEVMAPLCRWARNPAAAPDRGRAREQAAAGWHPRGRLARFLQVWETQGRKAAIWGMGRGLLAGLADALAHAVVLRRRTNAWGLDPREPPASALVIRAGSAALARQVVARLRERYPTVEITVLAPEELAEETRYETGAPVIAARGAGAVSYRITTELVRALHQREYDTVMVAGEGNRRAELAAVLAGFVRRVEVREDGAAHTFGLAPYKPLLLLLKLVAGIVEKVTLTALVGLTWGALWAEGKVWRVRDIWGPRRGSAQRAA